MCIVQVCHSVPCDCFRLIILNIATTNHMDQGWNHKWHDRTLWVTQRVIKPSRIFYIDHKVIFYSALYVELLVLLKKNPPQCFIGFGKEYIFRTLKYFTDKARNPYIRMCICRADMSWVCDIIATRVLPHQVYKLFTSLFWDRLFLFLRHVVVPVQGKSPASDVTWRNFLVRLSSVCVDNRYPIRLKKSDSHSHAQTHTYTCIWISALYIVEFWFLSFTHTHTQVCIWIPSLTPAVNKMSCWRHKFCNVLQEVN